MTRFRRPPLELPATWIGRVVLCLACLVLLPFSVFGIYMLIFVVPLPQTVLGWVTRIVFESLFLGLLFVSIFGLVWGVARPAWAERLLQQGTLKLILALLALFVLGFPLIVWVLLNM